MESNALLWPILIPLAAALLVPFVDLISKDLRAGFCAAAAGLTVFSLYRLQPAVSEGNVLVYWMGGWQPRGGLGIGISLSLDAWGLLIALIIAVVGFLSLVYSAAYLQHETGREAFYVLFMLLIAALIGFALSGDLFNQFVWLEVFSVAAFALTGFHYNERASIEAAFKYLITNSIASLFIAVALSLLYMQTGALNLAHIAATYHGTPAGMVALGLLVGGYATKAALVPWHFWLPDAHTVAPAPVSAFFSGALIKIGIYAIARSLFTLAPELFTGALQTPLLYVAAISMLVGGFQMLLQGSIKRILAFSSVSQMGYALMGLAIGTPLALAGAAMHLIHHALVKSALFMGAGVLTWQGNIHTLKEGGGLARRMPLTLAVFFLGGLSLSGIPFFSGYISKTILEEAASEAHFNWLAYTAIFASLLTFAGIGRLIWFVFFSKKSMLDGTSTLASASTPAPARTGEAPVLALIPMLALVFGSLWIGSSPGRVVASLAWPAALSLDETERYVAAVLETGVEITSTHSEMEDAMIPNPADWHHWLPPAVVLVGGSLYLYWMVARRVRRVARTERVSKQPLAQLAHILRQWHSGIVNDYALWTAFGTAFLLVILFVITQMNISIPSP